MLNRLKNIFGKKKFDSKQYWEERYAAGGSSGSGSYGRLADFKADVLNKFVSDNNVNSIIEFGCGDGNQLSLAGYPSYIGLDVSKTAIQNCVKRFQDHNSFSFFLYEHTCFHDRSEIFTADLALSLDVLYHLIEKDVYENYLQHLFSSSTKFVIIYANDNSPVTPSKNSHEYYRKFSDDIITRFPEWEFFHKVENIFKVSDKTSEDDSSDADFFFYRKKL